MKNKKKKTRIDKKTKEALETHIKIISMSAAYREVFSKEIQDAEIIIKRLKNANVVDNFK